MQIFLWETRFAFCFNICQIIDQCSPNCSKKWNRKINCRIHVAPVCLRLTGECNQAKHQDGNNRTCVVNLLIELMSQRTQSSQKWKLVMIPSFYLSRLHLALTRMQIFFWETRFAFCFNICRIIDQCSPNCWKKWNRKINCRIHVAPVCLRFTGECNQAKHQDGNNRTCVVNLLIELMSQRTQSSQNWKLVMIPSLLLRSQSTSEKKFCGSSYMPFLFAARIGWTECQGGWK